MPAKYFLITGQVQGVFFRAEAQIKAVELELKGWVRNTNEGAVEIHAEGSDDSLKKLEQWCWKGPERARVKNVSINEVPQEELKSFEIRP